jgi:hypothetical protein
MLDAELEAHHQVRCLGLLVRHVPVHFPPVPNLLPALRPDPRPDARRLLRDDDIMMPWRWPGGLARMQSS